MTNKNLPKKLPSNSQKVIRVIFSLIIVGAMIFLVINHQRQSDNQQITGSISDLVNQTNNSILSIQRQKEATRSVKATKNNTTGIISNQFIPQEYEFGDLIINEIAWMGNNASGLGEWLELYNPYSQIIDLNNWLLVSTDKRPTIKLTGTILGKGYFLLERNNDQVISDIVADQIYSGRLSNQGERLQLFDATGNLIDEVDCANGWLAGSNIAGQKATMERDEQQGWHTNEEVVKNGLDAQGRAINGTPRQVNSLSSNAGEWENIEIEEQYEITGQEGFEELAEEMEENLLDQQYSMGDLVINELMSDNKTEWIELYNNSDKQIDLNDWTITDNTNHPKSLDGLVINARQWLLLTKGINFSFALNNQGDILELKYQDQLIDQLTYGDYNDGQLTDNAFVAKYPNSLARKIDGRDSDVDNIDFTITTIPTPGMANVINEPELPNRSPIAIITAPLSALVGEMVYFSGVESYDLDSDVLAYFWDFGDGTTLTGQEKNHIYQSPGQYLVSLMVVDEQGADHISEQIIQILTDNNNYFSGTDESESSADSDDLEQQSDDDETGTDDQDDNPPAGGGDNNQTEDDYFPVDSNSDDDLIPEEDEDNSFDDSSSEDSLLEETDDSDEPVVEPSSVQYLSSDLTINEVISNPSSGQSEWIELYNNTEQMIDLTDWTIEDNTSSPKSLAGLTISSHNWLVLTGGGTNFSFYLNNSGDILKLKYQDQLIDQLSYGNNDDDSQLVDNAPVAEQSNALARLIDGQDSDLDKNDFTVTTTPTPGIANLITEPEVIDETSEDSSSSSETPQYNSLLTSDARGCILPQILSEDGRYYLSYRMLICPETTLTIKPGTVIKFGSHYGGLVGSYYNGNCGKIIAQGTLDKPIIFTSWRDDQYGGDLDGGGQQEISPDLDYWGAIELNGAGSILDHVIVRYGGANQHHGAVVIWSPETTVINSVFEHNLYNIAEKENGATIDNNIYN